MFQLPPTFQLTYQLPFPLYLPFSFLLSFWLFKKLFFLDGYNYNSFLACSLLTFHVVDRLFTKILKRTKFHQIFTVILSFPWHSRFDPVRFRSCSVPFSLPFPYLSRSRYNYRSYYIYRSHSI